MQIRVRQPLLFEAFIENAKLEVGDGGSIMFWKDVWLGNIPFQSLFPTIFRILCNKSEYLGDVLARFEDTQRWGFLFRRSLLDRKAETFTELKELLNGSGVVAASNSPDCLIWQGCSFGKFSIKSIYNIAISSHSSTDKTFKLIWKNVAPPVCNVLAG